MRSVTIAIMDSLLPLTLPVSKVLLQVACHDARVREVTVRYRYGTGTVLVRECHDRSAREGRSPLDRDDELIERT